MHVLCYSHLIEAISLDIGEINHLHFHQPCLIQNTPLPLLIQIQLQSNIIIRFPKRVVFFLRQVDGTRSKSTSTCSLNLPQMHSIRSPQGFQSLSNLISLSPIRSTLVASYKSRSLYFFRLSHFVYSCGFCLVNTSIMAPLRISHLH